MRYLPVTTSTITQSQLSADYYYYYYYTRLKAFSRTTWLSQFQKGETSVDLNEATDDGVLDALALAGPYANNLHLAPDR